MSPRQMVHRAIDLQLDLIALTDHNSSLNCPALHDAAAGAPLTTWFGLELTTTEEVHALCLFDSLSAAMAWHKVVDARMPDILNDAGFLGEQVVVDERDEVVTLVPRMLINAVDISLRDAKKNVESLGGMMIPSHIDRSTNSLISQLGFSDEEFDALEVSPFVEEATLRREFPWIGDTPLVRFSDAHYLEDVGKQLTVLHMMHPTLAEMRLALQRRDGRGYDTEVLTRE